MKTFFRALVLLLAFVLPAHATSIIRDVELEQMLTQISTPIFKAAKLDPKNIHLYIVNDSEINAYVAGGQNIFINSGLIELSDEPDMLIGVIAHETGHIAGGHLARSVQDYEGTTVKATVGYILGVAAAAAGSPELGQAIVAGSGQVAQRQVLKHSRTQEESADQAALGFLQTSGFSPKGLLKLLEILYHRESALYGDSLNPYTLTHPLSRERIAHIDNFVKQHPMAHSASETLAGPYKLAIAKLGAFLDDPDVTLRKYPTSDQSAAALYSRAIAYYRIPNMAKAIGEIEVLIKNYPKNPFFKELKGQILFENGKVTQSIPIYQQAETLMPGSALMKIQLATAQIASENDGMIKPAIENLQQALYQEAHNSFAWHQIAIAYGRNNELDMSNLALAEESLLLDNKRDTEKFLALAKRYIKPGSAADIKYKDLQESFKSKR